MDKNHDQFEKEKELSQKFTEKMDSRKQAIINKLSELYISMKLSPDETRNVSLLVHKLFVEAFSSNRYEKPSLFFKTEMPWIYEYIIYPRFHEYFDRAVDQILDYPYSLSWSRRSYKSENYLSYANRIAHIVAQFQSMYCLDADTYDILTGNLPEDAYCYIKNRHTFISGFVPEVLACELDEDNPKLESAITDIINGESSFSVVTHDLIAGIVMSHNPRMHQLLCKLLLAAKLQEGLRQAICEKADYGTSEAFYAILSTILENDLIRYSSVKRAVGTWIGIVTDETRDLDRISNKSVELICKCLADADFRETCLISEDSMAIHIALWSTTFISVQNGFKTLNRLIDQGTHHQVLTAGYFALSLGDDILLHIAAQRALKQHREQLDIVAVYLAGFLCQSRFVANRISEAKPYPKEKFYFDNVDEVKDFCDWLFSLYQTLPKKQLDFNPCIFPWYSASLKKSELLEKSMVLAAAIKDQERIDKLCPYIADCDAYSRYIYFNMMTVGTKTSAIRNAIIDCMQDKSLDTRKAAYQRAKGINLTAEEYRKVEDMLRLRYDDLRRNGMELLMKQPDDALKATILRLLASPKTQMRTAGLDIVAQLSKSEDRKTIANTCMDAVFTLKNPTTQEKVLIDALVPKQTTAAEPLFSEEDRYTPSIEIDNYAKDCIAFFMELFPQSKLEKQIYSEKTTLHNSLKFPILPCSAAKSAKSNLISLSDYVVAHEKDTFTHYDMGEIPIGSSNIYFHVQNQNNRWTAPRMELWEQWRDENHITLSDLFGMLIALAGQANNCDYLIRCGKYIADLYGAGFETKVSVRYEAHVYQIVHDLIYENLAEEQGQQIAMALGVWIARCLPDDMLIGGENIHEKRNGMKIAGQILSPEIQAQINTQVNNQVLNTCSQFIAHPQIHCIFGNLSPEFSHTLKYKIPVILNVYERTIGSTIVFFADHGQTLQRQNVKFTRYSRLYKVQFRQDYHLKTPDVTIYLYARYFNLINDRTLYCHLMDPANFKEALELVTGVCAMEPKAENQISSKTFQHYQGYKIRRTYEKYICSDTLPREEQEQLVALCHQIEEKLVPIVIESELFRGDSPTDFSAYVTGIHALFGMDTFVRILSALGNDSLDRSVYYWNRSDSKRGNLSHLLSRCAPRIGDSAEKLKVLLKDTDITEKRLIEAALFSPAWIDIIGEYLDLPGFKSACYYFMAHMNEQFDDQKKAIIARFTPLNEDELNSGAFDVKWFHTAYELLGEKKFNLIYDAAKYISDGIKHTRARKYADAALGRISVEDTENTVKDKRNKDLLMAYAIIPLVGEDDLIHRYLYLQQFLKESRQFGAQRSASEKKAVETALRNLATNAGFSDTMRLTLQMETKLVENNLELFEEKDVDEWTFRLSIDEQGTAEIQCCKDGKMLKSIPAKAKKDPYVVRLQNMKKQLTDQYRRTRRMFEQAMEDCAEFTLEEMQQLCKNPVVFPIISKLIFKSEDTLGLFDGANLLDLDGNILKKHADAKLIVAHPLHLYQSKNWHKFQQYLFDNKIAQPFRQVFRELYVKTSEELGSFTSLRYAGNQIQPKKAAACLKERRWVADIDAGLQKVYYQDNIVATIYALADWFTPADIEAPTLEYVAFYNRKTGDQMKIDDIPDVIFSEVMRDVDMAVSVAHAGGVDPETSHSTVEMRTAILSFILPLLRLKNTRIEKSHVFIDGKLADYSVHLGSGIVHQIGGTMLNVLPVHSQHRGRFFLPFVDEDPKTAEIISKVILFAEDNKLKDPSILEQITR